MIFWLSVQCTDCYATRTPNYKKSELMLMRCTRAYGCSCSQLISVYLHPFRHTSLFCSQTSHKITKILYFQGHARSSMSIPLTSTSPLPAMIIQPNFAKKTRSFNAILPQVTAKICTCNFKPSYKNPSSILQILTPIPKNTQSFPLLADINIVVIGAVVIKI